MKECGRSVWVGGGWGWVGGNEGGGWGGGVIGQLFITMEDLPGENIAETGTFPRNCQPLGLRGLDGVESQWSKFVWNVMHQGLTEPGPRSQRTWCKILSLIFWSKVVYNLVQGLIESGLRSYRTRSKVV